MPVTVYDIARVAGVSRATVQRALLDYGRVSPETKARIKKIAAEMRYRPNQVATTLRRGRSNLLAAVMFPSVFTPVQSVHQPMLEAAHKAGYQMLFSLASGTIEDERVSLEQLLGGHVAGAVMLLGPKPIHEPILREMIDNDVKIVLFESFIEGLPVPQIMGDHYGGMRMLTQHLIDHGHRRIAYLAITEDTHTARERRRGFDDALAEAGVAVPEDYILPTEFSEKAGAESMLQLLQLPEPPTAVVARHDIVAMGAMDLTLAAGLSIPDHVSLVGAGGLWFNHALRVPLTTVHGSQTRITAKTIERLLAMLDGQEVRPGVEIVDVEFVRGSSCGPPNERGLREAIRRSGIANRSLADFTMARPACLLG